MEDRFNIALVVRHRHVGSKDMTLATQWCQFRGERDGLVAELDLCWSEISKQSSGPKATTS